MNRDLLARELDALGGPNFLESVGGGFLRSRFRSRYLVIAGRHRDLSEADSARLAQMNEDWGDIQIVTYDKLIDSLVSDHGFWWNGESLMDDSDAL